MDALYKELKSRGVTMSALISKACGVALAAHPRLWAACTPDGAGITYNEHINVANAVAMDGGLITPVLKDADSTDIYTLSRNWKVSSCATYHFGACAPDTVMRHPNSSALKKRTLLTAMNR
jgi:pyruvate/2-oxoglutarate dehydrogenase complex dihydrolipoamide acyltransferase (E2) component